MGPGARFRTREKRALSHRHLAIALWVVLGVFAVRPSIARGEEPPSTDGSGPVPSSPATRAPTARSPTPPHRAPPAPSSTAPDPARSRAEASSPAASLTESGTVASTPEASSAVTLAQA